MGRGDGGYCTTLDGPVRLWSRWQQVPLGQRVLRIDGKFCIIIGGSAYELKVLRIDGTYCRKLLDGTYCGQNAAKGYGSMNATVGAWYSEVIAASSNTL